MIDKFPETQVFQIDAAMEEYERYLAFSDRRLYLTSEIKTAEDEFDGEYASRCTQLVDDIIAFNRYDKRKRIKNRDPIRLYINSPGGDITEGFALVSAIEASTTPIYTINIGQWSSMAFLIGITGHRRISLPYMTFLMHEGTNFFIGATNKAQDKMKFDDRFEREVIRGHVLKHSKMTQKEYDALVRVEYYMLPEDALKCGFIDEITTSLDTIL